MDLEGIYDDGVAKAQAFIDRHPHGYPTIVMDQDVDLAEPENELEREFPPRLVRTPRRASRHRGRPQRELEAEDAGVRPVARLDRLTGRLARESHGKSKVPEATQLPGLSHFRW